MTVQTMHRTGGRRFGPTALAGRAEPMAGVARSEGVALGTPRRQGEAALVARPQRQHGRASTRGRVAVPARTARGMRTVAECPTGSAAGPYRMGRWARLSMTVVVTAAIIIAALTVVLRPASVPTTLVTVGPGDTLASIVARDLPGWDFSRAMDAITSLNDLAGRSIGVGTVLRIPASR